MPEINFENMPSATLLTEYNEHKKMAKHYKDLSEKFRDEIEKRLNANLPVENETTRAKLQTAEYRTYSVRSALTVIRKHKLDPGALLNVVNKAVKALPAEIRDTIKYVTEVKHKVVVKTRE